MMLSKGWYHPGLDRLENISGPEHHVHRMRAIMSASGGPVGAKIQDIFRWGLLNGWVRYDYLGWSELGRMQWTLPIEAAGKTEGMKAVARLMSLLRGRPLHRVLVTLYDPALLRSTGYSQASIESYQEYRPTEKGALQAVSGNPLPLSRSIRYLGGWCHAETGEIFYNGTRSSYHGLTFLENIYPRYQAEESLANQSWPYIFAYAFKRGWVRFCYWGETRELHLSSLSPKDIEKVRDILAPAGAKVTGLQYESRLSGSGWWVNELVNQAEWKLSGSRWVGQWRALGPPRQVVVKPGSANPPRPHAGWYHVPTGETVSAVGSTHMTAYQRRMPGLEYASENLVFSHAFRHGWVRYFTAVGDADNSDELCVQGGTRKEVESARDALADSRTQQARGYVGKQWVVWKRQGGRWVRDWGYAANPALVKNPGFRRGWWNAESGQVFLNQSGDSHETTLIRHIWKRPAPRLWSESSAFAYRNHWVRFHWERAGAWMLVVVGGSRADVEKARNTLATKGTQAATGMVSDLAGQIAEYAQWSRDGSVWSGDWQTFARNPKTFKGFLNWKTQEIRILGEIHHLEGLRHIVEEATGKAPPTAKNSAEAHELFARLMPWAFDRGWVHFDTAPAPQGWKANQLMIVLNLGLNVGDKSQVDRAIRMTQQMMARHKPASVSLLHIGVRDTRLKDKVLFYTSKAIDYEWEGGGWKMARWVAQNPVGPSDIYVGMKRYTGRAAREFERRYQALYREMWRYAQQVVHSFAGAAAVGAPKLGFKSVKYVSLKAAGRSAWAQLAKAAPDAVGYAAFEPPRVTLGNRFMSEGEIRLFLCHEVAHLAQVEVERLWITRDTDDSGHADDHGNIWAALFGQMLLQFGRGIERDAWFDHDVSYKAAVEYAPELFRR